LSPSITSDHLLGYRYSRWRLHASASLRRISRTASTAPVPLTGTNHACLALPLAHPQCRLTDHDYGPRQHNDPTTARQWPSIIDVFRVTARQWQHGICNGQRDQRHRSAFLHSNCADDDPRDRHRTQGRPRHHPAYAFASPPVQPRSSDHPDSNTRSYRRDSHGTSY
jgi:hypothetical protein